MDSIVTATLALSALGAAAAAFAAAYRLVRGRG